jgi:Ca-activated chloride channel family protein
MNWAAPEFAWLLLLALPLAYLIWRERDWRRQARLALGAPAPEHFRRQRLVAALRVSALLLMVVALCRPQWGEVVVRQESRGLDILIALDVSRSMLADDLHPNRLAAAKTALRGMLEHLRGDRVGLIAFAGSAFLVCPLTSDYAALAEAIASTDGASLPLGGSSLVGALTEARRAFTASDGRDRHLIVISDGEDNGGDLAAGAHALRAAGIQVHGVAAASAAGGLIPQGHGDFLKDRNGAIVRSRLHVETLRALATGELFDLAADPGALDQLQRTRLAGGQRGDLSQTRRQLAERYQYPLALAVLLLLLEPGIARWGRP